MPLFDFTLLGKELLFTTHIVHVIETYITHIQFNVIMFGSSQRT